MKLTFKSLLLLAALIATTGINATNTESSEPLPNDTTEVREHKIGNWIITRESITSTPDEDETTSETKVSVDIRYKHDFTPHFPVFYIGLNAFTPDRFATQFADIPLNSTKSWEWGSYLFQESLPFGKSQHVGLTTALGFGRAMYKMDNTRYFYTDADRMTHFGNPDEYDVTWLRYWTLKLPLVLTFETEVKGDDLFFSVGPELEYRFSGASKGRVGNNKKEVIANDLNLNPLGVNLMAQFGYDGFSLIGKVSLIELFRKPDLTSPYSTSLYPATFGIAINF